MGKGGLNKIGNLRSSWSRLWKGLEPLMRRLFLKKEGCPQMALSLMCAFCTALSASWVGSRLARPGSGERAGPSHTWGAVVPTGKDSMAPVSCFGFFLPWGFQGGRENHLLVSFWEVPPVEPASSWFLSRGWAPTLLWALRGQGCGIWVYWILGGMTGTALAWHILTMKEVPTADTLTGAEFGGRQAWATMSRSGESWGVNPQGSTLPWGKGQPCDLWVSWLRERCTSGDPSRLHSQTGRGQWWERWSPSWETKAYFPLWGPTLTALALQD